ncbi:hypothetical protein EG329_003545 [Mollisiaceae sp. DMI_Dod_QoI]|nr:hypothetical protein EG329_003545 [Helotiales sp. DMI_Dod_QoI]
MSQSTSNLGTLGRLPPEVRILIWQAFKVRWDMPDEVLNFEYRLRMKRWPSIFHQIKQRQNFLLAFNPLSWEMQRIRLLSLQDGAALGDTFDMDDLNTASRPLKLCNV